MEFDPQGLKNESEKNLRVTKALETFFGKLETSQNDRGTAQFLNDLYSYPPKFTVSVGIADRIPHDSSASQENNKTLPREQARKTVKNVSYSALDYFKGYLNKNFTSTFYSSIAKPIKNALQSIPVYVVLNGQDEIVLAHDTAAFGPSIPNNRIYDLCGAFADNGVLQKGKLGLFFMSYEDAKVFMNSIIEYEPDEANIVGLAIHCVGLDSAYDLVRRSHPGIDFRFIPKLEELISVSSIARDSHFVFNESSIYESPLNKLTETSLEMPVKGVPVYLVQLQDTRQGFLTKSLRTIVTSVDSVMSLFIKPYMLGRTTLKTQGIPKLDKTMLTSTTHVFFDHKEALRFSKINNRQITHLPGSSFHNSIGTIVKKPTIFVTSLETLLDTWENDLLTINSKQDKKVELWPGWDTLKFIPNSVPEVSWNKEKIKLLNSPLAKFGRTVKVRYNLLKFTLGYLFWEA